MLKITSKHLEVTAPIRERVESRLAKLERYDIQLINPHVIISEEKPLFKIEATVKVPQGELFAQAKHENLYNAINAMGQKLQKQLNRLAHKDEAKRHTGKLPAEDIEEEEAEYDEYVA
ncbi:ribosome-associated translation inhibitor RaiA [Shewanella corallii]|uniref:Ribosome-associated translation inhibitor RaiA n=2 Tax=Shewanella TaxID=22 RepID=A0ABT0N4J4_9GAMM|nr:MULTISPECIES: ribosome-associated translation inhibitor RaiA [Shewanella]MCL1036901.1 ribosome-associated translation inhibitor RaiA [Shewanella submarina]MCL2913383.1 ribosome-associated translation inhibitor RaiA [Shewanella corallii]